MARSHNPRGRRGSGSGSGSSGDGPKARGARSNPESRFHAHTCEPVDDGWSQTSAQASAFEFNQDPALELNQDEAFADDEAMALSTEVKAESITKIISRNDSPDLPFDRSINPYKGCEHGCIYCFARPSHAYLGLSPGLDFESKIIAKPDAARALRDELGKASYQCRPLALGSNTDPYQPAERTWGITRSILQVLRDCRHPVSIVSKSVSILRDLELLQALAADNLANVFISLTTLDDLLARRMEPRASSPKRRLHAIRTLAKAGVPVGVSISPIIPGLNDCDIEHIMEAAADAGAQAAFYVFIRLPREVKDLFGQWLAAHYPERADKVLSLIRQSHGGALYRAEFGQRMRGQGVYAALIAQRFDKAARRFGLQRGLRLLDCGQFVKPDRKSGRKSDGGGQLSLF